MLVFACLVLALGRGGLGSCSSFPIDLREFWCCLVVSCLDCGGLLIVLFYIFLYLVLVFVI